MPIKDPLKPDLTHLDLWYHVSAHRSLSVLSVEVYSRIQQESVLLLSEKEWEAEKQRSLQGGM